MLIFWQFERCCNRGIISRMREKSRNNIKGTITIEDGANIWPHELHTAKALANAGHTVRFIPNNASLATADAYVDNTLFEFKSPEGTTIK